MEIDPEIGEVNLERYSVVDDFGNLFNPMLVESQLHGGVAQGIGQAISEQVVYDENGQLLTATLWIMVCLVPKISLLFHL